MKEVTKTVKGCVGEAIVKAVLTSAGYRVVPFGVEVTLRELCALLPVDYVKLHLPMVLRKMPDFVVATENLDQVTLVEVKYRKDWSDLVSSGLFQSLQPQVKQWPNIVLVVVFRSFGNGDPAVRCLQLRSNPDNNFLEVVHKNESINWNSVTEDHFLKLRKVFPMVTISDSELTKFLKEELLG